MHSLLEEVAKPEHFGALLLDCCLAVLGLYVSESPPHRSVHVQLVFLKCLVNLLEHSLAVLSGLTRWQTLKLFLSEVFGQES